MLVGFSSSSIKLPTIIFLIGIIIYSGIASAAILIDDFWTPQSVPKNSSGTALGEGILNQERYVYNNNATTAEINTTAAHQAVFSGNSAITYTYLRYDGIGSSNNGLNNMDLTDGGQYTGFLVTVTGYTGNFHVFMEVGQEGNQISELSKPVSGVGTIFMPFADFVVHQITYAPPPDTDATYTEVDFTNVGYIVLSLHSGSLPASITLDSFQIVPEPATMSLLAIGVIALRRTNK